MHKNRRIHAINIVAAMDVCLPPGALEVILKLHAKRPIVPGIAQAPVNIRAGEYEPAPFAERNNLIHQVIFHTLRKLFKLFLFYRKAMFRRGEFARADLLFIIRDCLLNLRGKIYVLFYKLRLKARA